MVLVDAKWNTWRQPITGDRSARNKRHEQRRNLQVVQWNCSGLSTLKPDELGTCLRWKCVDHSVLVETRWHFVIGPILLGATQWRQPTKRCRRNGNQASFAWFQRPWSGWLADGMKWLAADHQQTNASSVARRDARRKLVEFLQLHQILDLPFTSGLMTKNDCMTLYNHGQWIIRYLQTNIQSWDIS